MKSNIQISLCSLLLVLSSLLTACEVIGPGEREEVIFTPTDLSAVKRTSLLVEYTGWQCVFCPTAAEEAHRLKELYGEQLVVVAMHPKSNSFTNYGKNEALNFTCPEADSIYIKMGGTAATEFPRGNINMVTDNVNGYFNKWDTWATLISQAYASPKPVIISQEVKATTASKDIDIVIDITNLDSKTIDATLQVWLTEDSIIGSQKKPEGTDKNYAHNHLMRASISPLWGDVISISAQEKTKMTYQYTLPEKVVKENCNVVAFVSVNGEVVQAHEARIITE